MEYNTVNYWKRYTWNITQLIIGNMEYNTVNYWKHGISHT